MRTLFALWLVGILGFAANLPAPRDRSFSFEYAVTVKDVPTGAHTVDIWLPAPHDDAFQRIVNLHVDAPYPYEIATGTEDNHILHIRVTGPKEPAIALAMRFDAVRKEHIQPLPAASLANGAAEPAGLERYLQPDRLVPLDDTIRRWAREVVDAAGAKTDLEMARAVGIPARFAIGFPLPADRGAGKIAGYHCWAEFYAKGIGWVPVDASEAAKNPAKREYFFGAHDQNRVELSKGRDVILVPKQHGGPLNYFVYPYVEPDGGKYLSLDTRCSYKDLPL
jgi:transglutaminase-like putative cysteine protease